MARKTQLGDILANDSVLQMHVSLCVFRGKNILSFLVSFYLRKSVYA